MDLDPVVPGVVVSVVVGLTTRRVDAGVGVDVTARRVAVTVEVGVVRRRVGVAVGGGVDVRRGLGVDVRRAVGVDVLRVLEVGVLRAIGVDVFRVLGVGDADGVALAVGLELDGYTLRTPAMSSLPSPAHRPSKRADARMVDVASSEWPKPMAWPISCVTISARLQRFQNGHPAKPLAMTTLPSPMR
jgi:hypothetical protein